MDPRKRLIDSIMHVSNIISQHSRNVVIIYENKTAMIWKLFVIVYSEMRCSVSYFMMNNVYNGTPYLYDTSVYTQSHYL